MNLLHIPRTIRAAMSLIAAMSVIVAPVGAANAAEWDLSATGPQAGAPTPGTTSRTRSSMSRTDKDRKDAKMRHWMSVFTPSKFNRWRRRQEREWARQDMRNRREPQPRYRDEHYW